jgi:hypothetical protein
MLGWLVGAQVGLGSTFLVCGIGAEVALEWPGWFRVMGPQVGLKVGLLLKGPLTEVAGKGAGSRLDTGQIGVELWHS